MEGQVLDDRFRVVRKLGSGGMAEVWLAHDLLKGGQAAVKVLNATLGAEPERAKRFQREFAACARLDHPNIVRLFLAGRLPGGGAWYAMEYLPWATLDAVIEERGRLGEADARLVMGQVASALGHAHGAGLVHRDVKPGNVMVDEAFRAKLMDFGLVRDDTATQLTATGSFLGTPAYVSPELLLGRPADARSDVYQLGLLAYEMLSGRRAFAGSDVTQLTRKIMAGEYPPLHEAAPDVSPAAASLVSRCMAAKPEHRFADGRDVASALERVGRPGAKGSGARSAGSTAAHPAVGPRPAQRPSTVAFVVMASVLGCAAGLSMGLGLWSPAPVATPGPPAPAAAPVAPPEFVGALRLGDGLRFTWRSGPAAPTAVRLLAGDRELARAAPVPAGTAGAWAADLASFPPAGDELVLEGEAPLRLSGVFRSQARALGRRLAALDAPLLLQGLAERAGNTLDLQVKEGLMADPDQTERNERRRGAGGILQTRLQASGILPAWRQASALAPFLFQSSLLPVGERLAFHRDLQPMWNVYLFASVERLPRDLLLPAPDLGAFGLASSPLPGPHRELRLFPAPGGPAGLLELGCGFKLTGAAARRSSASFELQAAPGAGVGEVRMTLVKWGKTALRLRLNDRLELLLLDQPLLAHPQHLPWFVCQRFPTEVLKGGTNRLELVVDELQGRAVSTTIKIKELVVRLPLR